MDQGTIQSATAGRREQESKFLAEKLQKDMQISRGHNPRIQRGNTAGAGTASNDPISNAIEAIQTLYPKVRNDTG
jgi:hypothetical protein